ncbi:exported hypothetical protein [Burkholderiales bacterium 8X]|nr:exported hypothetical protein [Burkholderiales bacterium 8X]
MHKTLFALSILIGSCLPAAAELSEVPVGRPLVAESQRAAKPVKAQRTATAATTPRKLTPDQLAELRQQVRDQWVPRRQAIAGSVGVAGNAGGPMLPSRVSVDPTLSAPVVVRP